MARGTHRREPRGTHRRGQRAADPARGTHRSDSAAFGSVIAGTALLGAVGALIAIPATATLQAFLGAYVKRYAVTDDARVHGHRGRGTGGPGIRARVRRLRAGEPGAAEES
ncbi:hypothetical protein BIV25_16430 [Streptomyces sp. MUSC 14]|nr:hypothetical protein BIV25_16430 [Streptomyces sp. MUSC 14]